MKPVFYDQEMRDTEMTCIQEPHKALLGFKKKLARATVELGKSKICGVGWQVRDLGKSYS